jgi:Flp pilus assembly protein TadG
MNRRRCGLTSSPRQARGLATVEAAITLPLLLLLMLATAEFSRAYVQYTILANSVRNAARHLAGKALLNTMPVVSITPSLLAETRNLAVYGNEAGTGSPKLPGFSTAQVTASDAGNTNVLISAVYPYQPLIGPELPTFGLGGGPVSTVFNMQIDVTMRALWAPDFKKE